MADINPPDPQGEALDRASADLERRVRAQVTAAKEGATGADAAAAELKGATEKVRSKRGKVAAASEALTAEQQRLIQEYIDAQQRADATAARVTGSAATIEEKRLLKAAQDARAAAVRAGAISQKALPTVGGATRISQPAYTAGDRPSINPYSPTWLERIARARAESPNFQATINPRVLENIPQFSTGLVGYKPSQGSKLGDPLYGILNQQGVAQKGLPSFPDEAKAQAYLQRIQAATAQITGTVTAGAKEQATAVEASEKAQTAAVEQGAVKRTAARKAEGASLKITPFVSQQMSGSSLAVPGEGYSPGLVKQVQGLGERGGTLKNLSRDDLHAISDFTRSQATAVGDEGNTSGVRSLETLGAKAEALAGTVRKAEVEKTAAVEEGTTKREAAMVAETRVIGDNAAELEAKAVQIEASVRQAAARAQTYNAQAAAGGVPPVNSAEFQRKVRENAAADAQRQAELEAARTRAAPIGPGANIIPHPELFGRQAYAPLAREQLRPPIQETGDPILRGRTALARAEEQLAQAQLQRAKASNEVSRLVKNAAKTTEQELAAATRAKNAADEVFQARKAEVAAIRAGVEEQIAANARLRGDVLPVKGTQQVGPTRQSNAETRAAWEAEQAQIAQQRAQQVAIMESRLRARNAVPTEGTAEYGPQLQPGSKAAKDQARAAKEAAVAEEELSRNTARTAGLESLLARNTEEARLGVQHNSVAMESNSQALRKHGALTTEFISQAARGQSTYREFGFQIGATAAKFAGWTAVSIPVFAALDGVRKIGEGAIASASGVNTLKRTINDVNPGTAQSSFRDLSSQFNVPIKDVVDAVSGMGAVFHHQADAVDAARAALYAYKTGGVDVATATKDLVAIQQGLGASSTDLLDIFDKLNFVQNNYGARIPDLESGVARTAGAFKTAGGSVNELISLLVTLNRQANVTGPQAATIIGRTIGNVRKPSSQAALRGYGIDPTAPIGQLFSQAQTVAQAPGADVRGIAQALGGQYFARQLTPLLLRKSYTDTLRGQLDSGQAKGSSQKELNSVLAQLDEQIKKVGEDLGRLGSNLAESGFLTPLEGMVGLLHESLTLINGLLGAFNQLPAPLKDSLTLLLEMRGVMSVLRKLGVGAGLQDNGRLPRVAPYLVETTDRQTAKLVDRGLTSVTAGARDNAETATRASFTAATARLRGSVIAQEDLAAVEKQYAAGAVTEEEYVAEKVRIQERITELNSRALLAQREQLVALQGVADIEAAQADLQGRLRGVPKAQHDAIKRQFAQEYGMPVPGALDAPTAVPVQRIDESGALVADQEGQRLQEQTNAVMEQRQKVIREHARIGTTLSRGFTRQVTAFQEIRGQEGTLTAVAQRSGALAATAGSGVLTGIKAAGSGITRLGSSLAASIGPLGAIIIGATVIEELVSQMEHNRAALKARSDLTGHASQVGTVADYRATRQKLLKESQKGSNFGDSVRDAVRGTGVPLLQGLAGPDQNLEERQQGRQGLRNLPNRNLLVENIGKGIQAAVTRFNEGQIGISSLNNLLDQQLDRIKASPAAPGAKRDLRNTIATARLSAQYGSNFYQTLVGGRSGNLSALTDTVLKATSDGLNAIIGIGQANHKQVQHFFAQQLAIMGRTRGLNDPASQQAYAAAYQAIQSAQQTLTQQGVADGGRGDLRTAMRRTLAALAKARKHQAAEVRKLAAQIAGDQHLIDEASVFAPGGALLVPTIVGQPTGLADRSKAQGMKASILRAMASSRRQSRALVGALRDMTQAIDDGQAQIARIEAETALAVAQASTPHGEYLATQHGLQRELAKTKDPTDRINLQAQIISGQKAEGQRQQQAAAQARQDAKSRAEAAKQAAEAARQAAIDLVNARYDYLESLTDSPIRIDKLEVKRANAAVGSAKGQTERYRAEAQRNAATRKLREDVTNRRIEDLDFSVEIGRMTTDHEIRALQSILKTTTLGTEFKRGLRQKILRLQHDLNSSDNLDQLNVGNIKLPTVYDVRRLARQGTNSAPVSVQQNYTYDIHVANRDDIEALGVMLDTHTGGATRAAMRSVGAVG